MTLSLKVKFFLAAACITLAISGYIFLTQRGQHEMSLLMRQVLSNNLLAMDAASEVKHAFVFYDNLIFRFISTVVGSLLD